MSPLPKYFWNFKCLILCNKPLDIKAEEIMSTIWFVV
jgi:hypothetical protein